MTHFWTIDVGGGGEIVNHYGAAGAFVAEICRFPFGSDGAHTCIDMAFGSDGTCRVLTSSSSAMIPIARLLLITPAGVVTGFDLDASIYVGGEGSLVYAPDERLFVISTASTGKVEVWEIDPDDGTLLGHPVDLSPGLTTWNSIPPRDTQLLVTVGGAFWFTPGSLGFPFTRYGDGTHWKTLITPDGSGGVTDLGPDLITDFASEVAPYRPVRLRDGDFLVATYRLDGAGNDVLRIAPDGSLVTTFHEAVAWSNQGPTMQIDPADEDLVWLAWPLSNVFGSHGRVVTLRLSTGTFTEILEPWYPGECFTLAAFTPGDHGYATPTVTTHANVASGIAPLGLADVAVLAGGDTPTGTLVFNCYGPGSPTILVITFTATVTNNGTFDTQALFGLSSVTPQGLYKWEVTYSGDDHNRRVVSNRDDPNEHTLVSEVYPGVAKITGGTAQTWFHRTGASG